MGNTRVVISKRPTHAAMIGAGMVAETYLAAFADARECVAFCGLHTRNVQKGQTFLDKAAPRHAIANRIYEGLQDVASDPEIDFVVVATPPDARLEVIAPLIAAGKQILVEKPVGRNASEAREVVAACKAAGVYLGVMLQHRARETSRQAKTLVESGTLGALGLAEISVPWWREQGYYSEPGRGTYARDGGGVLISQAIHTIDLALWLAGPVESVQAMTATTMFHNMEAEDFATAGLRFANGTVGSLTASTASYPGKGEAITLHFERATLHLAAGKLQVDWRDGRSDTIGEPAATGGGANPMAFTHAWHQAVLEDFASACRDNRPPMITGQDALPAHNVIEMITASAREGREIQAPNGGQA